MKAGLSNWLPRLWGHWLSLIGAIMATLAGLAMLVALLLDLVSGSVNIYSATFLFLMMPVFFVLGLLLIPLGLWRAHRRERRRGLSSEASSLPRAMAALLENRVLRRRLLFVAVATLANIVLIAGVGQRALHYMDTPEFCGTLCHTVMQPEYSAYLRSPHSRVACVECHIGPGASWAVRSKIDGLRQVWAVLTDSYERPIPSPIHDLRPARDTCERCHWPAKFHGNRVQFSTHYLDDKDNTAQVYALLLKIGGANPRTGRHEGMHWHVGPDVAVQYEALDAKRSKIGRIKVFHQGRQVAEYLPAQEGGTAVETRTMDCVDCHNRPTHIYDAGPGAAVDWALERGLLDPSLPFIRKLSVGLLQRSDRPREGVAAALTQELTAAYAKQYPELAPKPTALAAAAKTLADLYLRNIFPDMKVGWQTYPSHIGHQGDERFPGGCWRCHDDSHATAQGKRLSQDCDLCHTLLAEEVRPEALPESLKTLFDSRR